MSIPSPCVVIPFSLRSPALPGPVRHFFLHGKGIWALPGVMTQLIPQLSGACREMWLSDSSCSHFPSPQSIFTKSGAIPAQAEAEPIRGSAHSSFVGFANEHQGGKTFTLRTQRALKHLCLFLEPNPTTAVPVPAVLYGDG